jgi:hypothetical protein
MSLSISPFLRLLPLLLVLLGAGAASSRIAPTVEIAPGVVMPRVNLGTCCGSEVAHWTSTARSRGCCLREFPVIVLPCPSSSTPLFHRNLTRTGSQATHSFPAWYAAGGRGVDTALDYGEPHNEPSRP